MRITLRNQNWKNGINVELRGETLGGADLPLIDFGSKKIAYQDSWVIEHSWARPNARYEYRRDSNPDSPDGTFNEWTGIFFGGDREVVL